MYCNSYFIFNILILDPVLWSQAHVQHWIRWAINQFSLKNVTPSQWSFVDGPSLCNMTHTEFTQRIPRNPLSKDPNHDLFWTHLELLRKCKFVGNAKWQVSNVLTFDYHNFKNFL